MTCILFNKPFRVLCQFRDPEGRTTLADYITQAGVYAAGRLDYDSEGLMMLTDDGKLQARISQPKAKLEKAYWVQVEGTITSADIAQLKQGINLKDGVARASAIRKITEPPDLWPRDPPIRVRRNIPTSWIELTLTEGRNRQVRRMTAAVGRPTLRLIRCRIGPWCIENLKPGQHIRISNTAAWRTLRR